MEYCIRQVNEDGSLGGFWDGHQAKTDKTGIVLVSSFRELSIKMAEAQKVLKTEVQYFTYTGKTSSDFVSDSVQNKTTVDSNIRKISTKPQQNKDTKAF